jgi:hypothetical protein
VSGLARKGWVAAALALGTALGCGDKVEIGANGSAASGGATGDGAAGGGGACELARCQGHTYQCGDCLDNDGDGKIDSEDEDCLGPCDNTEDSYYGGIPGQNNSPCRQDCYFDQDTGSGNDDCYWSHNCDPLSKPLDYPPSGDSKCGYDTAASIPGTSRTCAELAQTQSARCDSYCGSLTPNGCDCFGCCELPQGSGKFVWLGSVVNNVGSCNLASIDDPTLCKPCTQVAACTNSCDECELCIGKTSVPDHCNQPDGGGEQCPAGLQACGLEGQVPCPSESYCITGCCILVPK